MNISHLNVWFMFVLALCCCTKVAFAQNYDNDGTIYITWNDLTLGFMDGGSDRVIVVDQNGNGDSLTVQGAVDMVPENNLQRVKIHILPGVYREKVYVPVTKPFISFIGDESDPSNTVITWNSKASDRDSSGNAIGTWKTASVTVESDYFCASSITFENTIVVPITGDEGYQAVALRISGDLAVFYKVRFLGSQDTLLDDTGTHYFYQCFIHGTTDFIFGYAKSLYQECEISSVAAYAIAANMRSSADDDIGFSFVNCTIRGNGTPYLGRALGYYARIIYSYTDIDIDVMEGGWSDIGDSSRDGTALFGEYNCRGRGANRNGRVGWSKVLDDTEARPFLDLTFINGSEWLRL